MLIVNFPDAFDVIKIIGMLYLITLGVIQWRKKVEGLDISTSRSKSVFLRLENYFPKDFLWI